MSTESANYTLYLSVVKQPAEYATDPMTPLITPSSKHWYLTTSLTSIVIFVETTCSFATKFLLHLDKKYGLFVLLKCNTTIDFPGANGTGTPVSVIIFTSI